MLSQLILIFVKTSTYENKLSLRMRYSKKGQLVLANAFIQTILVSISDKDLRFSIFRNAIASILYIAKSQICRSTR